MFKFAVRPGSSRHTDQRIIPPLPDAGWPPTGSIPSGGEIAHHDVVESRADMGVLTQAQALCCTTS